MPLKSEIRARASALRDVFANAGALPVETDILQPAEVLLDLYGEDIRARAYLVQDPVAGELFLRHAGVALSELRLAQSEVTVMDLAHLKELSLGIIDDFDNDLTPRLATILADSLTGCRFRMITDGSLELAAAMQALEDVLRAQALADAEGSGAEDIQVKAERDVRTAQAEAREIFVEAEITVEVTGRPRIAA